LQPVFEHAQRSHRVVSVDLRGFGESDAPEQSYTLEGYSDDLAFMAAELGLAKPVVVGHSMGGLIALDFAARYGDRLSAAVILEALIAPPEPAVARLRAALDGVRTERYRDVVTGFANLLGGPHMDPAERARQASIMSSSPQHVLVSAMDNLFAYDSAAAAARVACPLLYVGTSTTYTDLDRLRALCPQLETAELAGCGHFFPLEAPDQLNAVIWRFLQARVISPRPGSLATA
jgi:pimeloyl-ACP methyl ester carboxylesterase